MKRFLLILAALITISSITACSSGSTDQSELSTSRTDEYHPTIKDGNKETVEVVDVPDKVVEISGPVTKAIRIGWCYEYYTRLDDSGDFEYPYSNIYLVMYRDKEEWYKIATEMGTAGDFEPDQTDDEQKGARVGCFIWYAGGGSRYLAFLNGDNTISVKKKILEERGPDDEDIIEPGYELVKTIKIPIVEDVNFVEGKSIDLSKKK